MSSVHLRYLNPLPKDLPEVLKRFKKVLVPEINAGQLLQVLRAHFLVDARGFNRVRGQPLQSQELLGTIVEMTESPR